MVKVLTLGTLLVYLMWPFVAGAQQDTNRRILDLERIRAEDRLAAVEARIDRIEAIEIKSRLEAIERIANGLVIAAVGQLILNGLSLRKR